MTAAFLPDYETEVCEECGMELPGVETRECGRRLCPGCDENCGVDDPSDVIEGNDDSTLMEDGE